ncbi:extracellular solute-binding protein [Paenibacillus sp. YN15]|uniref:extracellular solute-binding protein n=1 Tax=Paenibacillus sp. YN15 TaxID=1742774 RepID=UPI0015EB9045|nr:extracellular solute-binding protein [Paenibacillus sp. YN15]
MSKQRSRIVPALAVILLLSISLAGCRQPSGGAEQEVGNGGGPVTRVKIEAMVSAQNTLPADASQDVIKQELDKAVGIDLKITSLVGGVDYRNHWNLRIAGNSPPDIFYVDRMDMIRLSRQGALLDLTPYLEQLESAIHFVGEDSLATGTVDGKVFGIPKTSPAPQYTLWLRQDWLERVGMNPPATLQELMLVMKAFTEKDPDGNGKNDTYGFTGNPVTNALDQIFGAFGTTFPGKLYIKDGLLTNSVYDPSMKQALAFLREMVVSGVVDPDFLANTKMQQVNKAYQGQVGVLNFNWPMVINKDTAKQIEELQPNARWIQIPPPEGPGGAYNEIDDFGARSILVMPVTLQNEPGKLEAIIRLLTYMSSPEGSRLVQYGLKNVHYTMDGSDVKPTDKINEVLYSHLYQLLGREEMTYLQTKFPAAEPYFRFAIAQPRIKVYDSFVQMPDDYPAADIKRYIMEQTYKFIYGNRPLEEYDEFVRTLEAKYGYDSYMKTAQRQLEEQGLLQ